MKTKDLTGARFNRLLAIGPVRKRDLKGRSAVYWLCKCDCGQKCTIAGGSLRAGLTQSCGCLSVESRKAVGTKHGGVGTRLYNAWINMKARCDDKSNLRYGGRGIEVCQQWRNSFEAFHADVGEPPSPEHSLDRFPDANGNYEPRNIRWATAAQQARNKEETSFIEVEGVRLSLADAAEKYAIPYDTLHNRIEAGWMPEQAVNLTHRPTPRGWKVKNRKRRFDGSIVHAERER